jgi:hypothetical protein
MRRTFWTHSVHERPATACEQTRLCWLGGFGKDRSLCLGKFLGTNGLCGTMS